MEYIGWFNGTRLRGCSTAARTVAKALADAGRQTWNIGPADDHYYRTALDSPPIPMDQEVGGSSLSERAQTRGPYRPQEGPLLLPALLLNGCGLRAEQLVHRIGCVLAELQQQGGVATGERFSAFSPWLGQGRGERGMG